MDDSREQFYIKRIEGLERAVEFLKIENRKQSEYIAKLFSCSTVKSLIKKRQQNLRKYIKKIKEIEKSMENKNAGQA